MAFAFVASADYDSLAATSLIIPVPTGTAANDLMIAFTKHVDACNSTPSGWTRIGINGDPATLSDWEIWWKLAGGSEPTDYTWGFPTSSRAGGSICTYRDGFDTADPIDVVSETDYTVDNTTMRAAGMTVSAANSPLIFICGVHSSSTKTFTPPTNPGTFVEDLDIWNTSSRFGRHFSSFVWTGSGATGDMDGTVSATVAGGKTAFAVALNPSGGGGGGGSPAFRLSLLGVGR